MNKSTRQQIIDKTADLLERQGFHATGLKQIVEESGTPRGSLYYYFPDGKEELAAEAVLDTGREINENIVNRLAAYDDPVEAVYQFALSLVPYMEQADCSGGAPLATVTLEAPATSENLRQACHHAYENLRQPFEDKLVEGGYPPTQAVQLSTLITAALEGAIILVRAQKSAEPIRQVATAVKSLLECTRPES